MADKAYSQGTPPDHYFDFSKTTSQNGMEYVMDSITQDIKVSFAFNVSSGCVNKTYTAPNKTADGLLFQNPLTGSNPSLVLQNANVVQFSSTWMIAMWVKITYVYINRITFQTLISASSNTNGSTYGNYNPLFRLSIIQQNERNGLNFDAFLVDPNDYSRSQYVWVVAQQNSTLTEGWVLLSVSVDSGTNSDTKITLRTRTPNNGKDSVYQTVSGFIYNTNVNFTLSNDILLGASCWRDSWSQYYANGPYVVMGRLYIWKSLSNIQNEPQFDKFFFRQSNGIPKCQGYIPCQYCVVGHPFPTTYTTTLSCQTNSVPKSVTTLLDWDFDFNMNPEYVIDQSGNGYDLYFTPVNQLTDSYYRVPGQGYYSDSPMQYAVANTRNYLTFNNISQFTIEAWIRRDTSMPVNTAWPYGIMLWIGQTSMSQGIFYFSASYQQQILAVWHPNVHIWTHWPNLMVTSKWTYVSVGMNYFYNGGYAFASSTWNVDGATQIHLSHINSLPTMPATDSNTAMYLISESYYYIKRFRIFNFMKYNDEMSVSINKFTSGTCAKLGSQAQCDVCPLETPQCLSTCAWNQYGFQCKNCHPFCGGCTGGTKNDCLYCAKTPTASKVVRSLTYGNCTCMVGFYYDSVSDSCLACNANCSECFGSNYTQCLTCASGKAFFPPNSCVSSCDDRVVLAGGSPGYFLQTDTVNSQAFLSCIPCHPYCKSCNGGLNSQCSACNTGYLLLGTTCTDTCPAGQWANLTASQCQACNPTCATCNGPLVSNCITCTNPAFVQQIGVCQASCNNGFYASAVKVCMPCNPACAICLNQYSNNCTSCNTGYYLSWLGFTCGTSCQSGTYADLITNQCLICHYSCLTCSGGGADQCTQCANSFLKSGVNCVTQCQSNQFQIGSSCLSCDSKCQVCSGVLDTQCSSCNSNIATGRGYYFFNNSCLEQCPDGYYPNDVLRICEACPVLCSTCVSQTNCTSCIFGPYKLNQGECTYFSCLGYQYRALTPQLSCYDCDQSCQTCQGFSQFDCLTCLSPQKFVSQQCLTCEDQPGMMTPIDFTQLSCQEICGDGFNYGQVQCDDGNNINGDGCSSKCTIESGWTCEGGSKLTPDVCTDIQKPVASLALINSDNQLYITFDKEVLLQTSLDTTTLKVTVTGTQSSYKFNWNINDQYRTNLPVQQLVLDMTFYSSLKGSSSELVTVEFIDPGVYVDASGNSLSTSPLTGYLNSYTYVDPALKAQLDAAGSSSMLATFGALAINLAISLIFGGQIEAMWTMINTIQLVSLLPLCNINYPQITILVFSKMLASQGETTVIPNIFFDKIVNKTGSGLKIEGPLNDRFSNYGWLQSNFIYLSGRKILIWTGLLFSYPLVWYMKGKYADKHKYCRFWIGTEQKYRYTMVLRGVLMSYLSMYLAAILNVFMMNFESLENTVSLFVSIAFAIALTYLPVMIMNVLQRNYAKIQTPKFMIQYSTIIKEVDLGHPIRYMYYPVFLLRRAVFALQLVLLANYPIGQIAAMSFTSFVMMIYIAVVKPQNSRIMIVLTAAGEGLLLFLHLFSIVFLDENLPEAKQIKLGWFVIVIVAMYILINWVIILTITIKDMIGKYRLWKEEKKLKKLKVKEDEDYLKWKKKKHILRKMEKEQKQEIIREQQQEKIDKFMQKKIDEEYKKTSAQPDLDNNRMPMFEIEQLDDKSFDQNSIQLFYQSNDNLLNKIQQQNSHLHALSNSQSQRFQSSFMIQSQRSSFNQVYQPQQLGSQPNDQAEDNGGQYQVVEMNEIKSPNPFDRQSFQYESQVSQPNQNQDFETQNFNIAPAEL